MTSRNALYPYSFEPEDWTYDEGSLAYKFWYFFKQNVYRGNFSWAEVVDRTTKKSLPWGCVVEDAINAYEFVLYVTSTKDYRKIDMFDGVPSSFEGVPVSVRVDKNVGKKILSDAAFPPTNGDLESRPVPLQMAKKLHGSKK